MKNHWENLLRLGLLILGVVIGLLMQKVFGPYSGDLETAAIQSSLGFNYQDLGLKAKELNDDDLKQRGMTRPSMNFKKCRICTVSFEGKEIAIVEMTNQIFSDSWVLRSYRRID